MKARLTTVSRPSVAFCPNALVTGQRSQGHFWHVREDRALAAMMRETASMQGLRGSRGLH